MAQKGRIYVKDASWYFRYKVPALLNGKKVWRDRYVKLAPASQFASALQVEKAGLVEAYKTDLDSSQMTPSSVQLLNDFIEHVYFPKREAAGDLRASTLVGYKNLWTCHLKPRFENLRMCDFNSRVARIILTPRTPSRARTFRRRDTKPSRLGTPLLIPWSA
jgi:hypothetical protein